jgi:hypothetical protein
MYNELENTKAIIFDIRNYPNSTSPWSIANIIYPGKMCFSKLTQPDLNFPGTHYWYYDSLGYNDNTSYYKGKVIILCDEQTQSAAEYTCMMLKAMPNSIIVGSQTAGADGNITSFKLSQDIQAGFTTLGVFYPDGTETQRVGIVPDSVVYPTAEGIRQGRDEILEKALEIAGCVVSVDEKKTVKIDFSISPNPADDNLVINYSCENNSITSLKICNTLGISVYESAHINNIGNNNSININTGNLAQGIYFVTIKAGNKTETKKFVVIR